MKSFEDRDFYCVDNLPPALLVDFVNLAERSRIPRVALSLDVRVSGSAESVISALERVRERGTAFDLLFLEASDEAIIRRYSETRRRHPCDVAAHGGLHESIARERVSLAPLRAAATRVWDTSQFTHAALGSRIAAAFADDDIAAPLAVRVVAFGFKFGIPIDADLVFDVRFFDNPNYVPELKPQTGSDPGVAAFLEALPETEPFLRHLFDTIDFLVPLYVREGKTRLTIAIGCTGGRHRSVYVANRLATHLAHHAGITISTDYRELAPA